MKLLIAVPCMSTVYTGFLTAMIGVSRPANSAVAITEATLIHSARNILAQQAVEGDYDRIMWIDSDMRVPRDLIRRLSADLDDGMDFVTAMCFKRIYPTEPTIAKSITMQGRKGVVEVYKDYPRGAVFEIEGTGFGAAMMTTDVYLKAAAACDDIHPFMPVHNLGEDYAFCCWARKAGVKLYCDSRIIVPHIGLIDYDDSMYFTEDEA